MIVNAQNHSIRNEMQIDGERAEKKVLHGYKILPFNFETFLCSHLHFNDY